MILFWHKLFHNTRQLYFKTGKNGILCIYEVRKDFWGEGWIHRLSPKMADLRGTHDIFCKIRPKEVFRVSNYDSVE